MPWVTSGEVINVVRHLSAGKPAGPDAVANEVLKYGLFSSQFITRADAPCLARACELCNACIDVGRCPSPFKASITTALQKLAAKNLAKIRLYRPIALLNTLGRLVEAVVAERMQYLFAERNILLPTRLGGKKAICCEDALHMLTEGVYRAWQHGKQAAALSLDIRGAFNNVSAAYSTTCGSERIKGGGGRCSSRASWTDAAPSYGYRTT